MTSAKKRYNIYEVSKQKARLLKKKGALKLLSDRKKKVLQAIVEEYVNTAEPVGSSSLVNNYG